MDSKEQWTALWRGVAILMLGCIIYFVQAVHADIRRQSEEITQIRIDGAVVKESLKQLDDRVNKLEQQNK